MVTRCHHSPSPSPTSPTSPGSTNQLCLYLPCSSPLRCGSFSGSQRASQQGRNGSLGDRRPSLGEALEGYIVGAISLLYCSFFYETLTFRASASHLPASPTLPLSSALDCIWSLLSTPPSSSLCQRLVLPALSRPSLWVGSERQL